MVVINTEGNIVATWTRAEALDLALALAAAHTVGLGEELLTKLRELLEKPSDKERE